MAHFVIPQFDLQGQSRDSLLRDRSGPTGVKTHRGTNAGEDNFIKLEMKLLHVPLCLHLLRPISFQLVFEYSIGSSPVFTHQEKGGRCLTAKMMSGHMLGGPVYQSLRAHCKWTNCINVNMV